MNIAGPVQGISGFIWRFLSVSLFCHPSVFTQDAREECQEPGTGGLAASLVLAPDISGLVFTQPEEWGMVISAVNPSGHRILM